MLTTVRQYVDILNDTYGLTRTLGVIDVCRGEDGLPLFVVGNNSVIFRIRCDGGFKMLKCYTRSKRNTRRIYGSRCLHDELFVHRDACHGEWVDVVLTDWIEGRTLRKAIADSAGDCEAMSRLAAEFDRLALGLLRDERAHGDLKPENIIVDADGRMHLIDFDAAFLPEFAGEDSEETGTTAYQHPSRTEGMFDRTIDDFPVALISTALRVMSVDADFHRRWEMDDILLFDPHETVAGRSAALDEARSLFARECMAVQYRIAGMLTSRIAALSDLAELLSFVAGESADRDGRAPELARRCGWWGYELDGRFVIPPVYDDGFEFREGLAAVKIGGSCHFIDEWGRLAVNCHGCEAIKPFRNGRAVAIRDGQRFAIDRNGRTLGPA